MNDPFIIDISPEDVGRETAIEETAVVEIPLVEEPVIDEITTEDGEVTPASIMYDYMIEKNIVGEDFQFTGKDEDIQKIIEELPERSFYTAISTRPKIVQDLVTFAFSKEITDVNELKTFFDTYLEPAAVEITVEDEEQARQFLSDYWKQLKVYRKDEDLEDALDNLETKESLISTAQEIAKEINEQNKLSLQAEIDKTRVEAEANKLAVKEEQDKLIEGIRTELETLKWTDARKQSALSFLDQKKLADINKKILKSPLAILQSADFYSYFNEEKGYFDFDKLVSDRTTSVENRNKLENIKKDSFSSSLSKLATPVKEKVKQGVITPTLAE